MYEFEKLFEQLEEEEIIWIKSRLELGEGRRGGFVHIGALCPSNTATEAFLNSSNFFSS